MSENFNVLHAPTVVGGNSSRLSNAEKKLGVKSFCLSRSRNYLGFRSDEIIEKNTRLGTALNVLRWGLLWILKYDVIHFNSGATILPYRVCDNYRSNILRLSKEAIYIIFEQLDLKIASFFGKVIFVTYQGDDARQGDYCRKSYPIHFVHFVDQDYYFEKSDKWKRRRIKLFDKYADVIYAVNPDLLNVLPPKARFLPYAGVDLAQWQPIWLPENDDFVPHVIHSPTHRLVKGTSFVEDAVQRLIAEGVKFKFTLIEGISNDEARKIYESADILIDQLLAGFYGGLGMELMSLGKPVICYMRNEDLIHLPEKMRDEIPIINATPETVYQVLKDFLTIRKNELRKIGIKSRRYVENWHDPIKVASIVVSDYKKILNSKNISS